MYNYYIECAEKKIKTYIDKILCALGFHKIGWWDDQRWCKKSDCNHFQVKEDGRWVKKVKKDYFNEQGN